MKPSAAFDVGLWLTALTLWFYALMLPPPAPLVVIDCQLKPAHALCVGPTPLPAPTDGATHE